MPSTTIFLQSINYEDLRKRGIDHRLLTLLWLYRSGKKNTAKRLFTNPMHFEVFKHLKNHPYSIFISNRYLVLTFVNCITIIDGRQTTSYSHYVIGINTDGRLFINKLNVVDFAVFCERSEILSDGVYYIPDSCVYHALGYHYDAESQPNKTLPASDHEDGKRKRYRVQGDLVFEIAIHGDYIKANYLRRVGEILEQQIRAVLSNLILIRMQSGLAEVGITSEIHGNVLRILAIPTAKRWSISDQFIETLVQLICKTTKMSDITSKAVFVRSFLDVDQSIPLNVVMQRGDFIYGAPYQPIEVHVWFSQDFINSITYQITTNLNVEAKERTVIHGRHKITYVGYPTRFNFVYEFPFENENGERLKTLFEVRMDELFITEGELKIEHVEHGLTKYTITQPIEIWLENTDIDRFFDARLNYYTFKLLQKKQLPVN